QASEPGANPLDQHERNDHGSTARIPRSRMFLKNLLEDNTKAVLQGYHLYWFPNRSMSSSKERLTTDLLEGMQEQSLVRERFDGLGRSHQSLLLALLRRDSYQGSLPEILTDRYGRQVEEFEVEPTIKTLLANGLVFKLCGNGSQAGDVYLIASEVGDALKRTIALEERDVLDMLAAERVYSEGDLCAGVHQVDLSKRIAKVADEQLHRLALVAYEEHHGILTFSEASHRNLVSESLNRDHWRSLLERERLGTTGVLSLKDFGIDVEEQCLVLDQDLIYADSLRRARCRRSASSDARRADQQIAENDVEVSIGTDFIIDIDRFLELIRTEQFDVTREGRLYKKTEDRISSVFITARYDEYFEGCAVSHIFEICRRLRFFTIESQKIVGDRLHRLAWQNKSVDSKLKVIYEHYLSDQQGKRWSFHQKALRSEFIDHLKKIDPGQWLAAKPFIAAVVARYLLNLEDRGIREEFKQHWMEDFQGETLMVPFAKLHHDLSYWVIHRLALVGLLDIGYVDAAFTSVRLSHLGLRFFGLRYDTLEDLDRPLLVNPDFEVVAFPGSSREEEVNLLLSRFADRLDSNHVKRYRLSRDSLKRGIISGLKSEEIKEFLELHSRVPLPPNVTFSLREWTDGVELIRKQKVMLLRASTAEGCRRLVKILEEREIEFEKLNDKIAMVRGSKSEKALRDLHEHFEKNGLFVE
ncbi:MAG: helicase-associated domain-containing protein, partial [Planctomycetes bacterium]|nr:helicase-associated domain-containing protein [Planctomycetota bacterium]